MKKSIIALTAGLLAIQLSMTGSAFANTADRALVLYDSPPGQTWGKLGKAYAIMLRNLLGHFNLAVDIETIESYTPGKVDAYGTTFYLGSYFDNPVSPDFLNDVVNTQNTVVWFKYNLWQLTWNPSFDFAGKYGFSFSDLRSLDAPPTPGNPNPGFFDTVSYKGENMIKYYDYDPNTGTVYADPDAGITQIVDPNKASAVANITNSRTSEQAPYVIRSQNLWYVADMPFSFIGPRDRYLAIADILHDMVSIDHTSEHKAMVRFEDVGALVSPPTMTTLTDYLQGQNIPFSIAMIPFYRDPLGVYNGGVPQEVPLSAAQDLLDVMNYATQRGGSVVMHGYTHQYETMQNPHSGVSGDDFEFWNIVENRPVDEDSEAWVLGRLDAGLAELAANGISAYAWEVPHYHASPVAYRAFTKRFDTTYQRAVYHTSDHPNLDPNNPNRDFAVGQFFPYIIHQDYYGQRILPENLGNIEYDISHIDPASGIVYTWQDVLLNARYAKVIRDGYGSFFFHPFWLEPDLGTPGFEDFKNLIKGISDLGYQWVSGQDL